VIAVDIRYRSKLGSPRGVVEKVLQFLWRWRIELTLAYLTLTATAVLAFEFYFAYRR